ncbi:MAG: hypothetical protein HC867_08710 [Bacteroidia bacterium]|nr:hypothetical protein [Bacteroidia bacterium]
MLKLLSSIFLILLTAFCNAQGSWDIGYLNVDSISKGHLGKIVRIDFKSTNAWISPDGQRHIRSFVGTKDTASLTIDTTLLILAERRKIYVDHGGYSDQYLECISCKNESLFIYDAMIVSLDDQTIQFQLDIEIKRPGQLLKKETKSLRIDRNKLDGVMYKL